MKRPIAITAAIFLALHILFAQNEKGVFDAESAKVFFEKSPDLQKQASIFAKSAETDYFADSLESAANKMRAAKYFATLSKVENSAASDLRVYILANTQFLNEFISILSPKDDVKKVFEILSTIRRNSPEKFEKYRNLAAAIAVVYDTPPPQNWPHGQVSEQLLPRKLSDPIETFNQIIDSRERGKFLLATEKLSIEELKYLVASPATDEDRRWVQKSIAINIPNIAKLYSSVSYDTPRLNAKQFDWIGDDYRLKTIKSKGGICTDQSYYTSEVAKARGVPAFIFQGAGSDGFHAWTAYMQKSGAWNFDVGRYANARFVTGTTIDPQTWEYATDHDLNSMREAFRNGAKYALSEIHSMFAAYFLNLKRYTDATTSATKSVTADPRNASAWKIAIISAQKSGKSKMEIVKIYDAAVKSFSKYPDIDADFRSEYIKFLIADGNDTAARKLTTSIIVKTKSKRPDIAMKFARMELQSDIEKGERDKLLSSYKRLLTPFKSDPAMAISGITIPIINSILKTDKKEMSMDILKASNKMFKSAKDESVKASLESIESQLIKILESANKKD